jgi:hypothetical protein
VGLLPVRFGKLSGFLDSAAKIALKTYACKDIIGIKPDCLSKQSFICGEGLYMEAVSPSFGVATAEAYI